MRPFVVAEGACDTAGGGGRWLLVVETWWRSQDSGKQQKEDYDRLLKPVAVVVGGRDVVEGPEHEQK